jgi:hypothetical protein
MSDSKVVKIHPKRRRGPKPPHAAEEKLRQVFLRLPESLYLRIEAAAAANYRTVTAECLMRMVRDDARYRNGEPDHADR